MNTYYVELNFSGSNTIDTGIAVSQGDYGKVQLSIACKKDGQFISDAESAEIIFQTEKGKVINGDLTGSGGLYGYVFQGNELQDPGKLVATVTLHYEDGQTSSESFLMAVRYNPLYDQNLQAGPYITQLEKLQAQAQGYVDYIGAIIEQLRQDIGETALTKADLQNDFLQSAPGLKALDAALGPQILQKFTQLYSNLATAIYSSDLMAAYDRPTFVRWDENTANTPYKAGLTMNQVGFAFCHGRYSGWQTIIAFSEGSKETFFHYCISGVPSNWLTIFSIGENTLADALHIGNNAGIYKVSSSTLNNPSITYGTEIILKDASSQWIFAIIIPTNLSAVYFDFYNGYGDSAGWAGWRKVDLIRVS